MRTTIVKRFKFEAAHQLPNHEGKCRDLHGHSYQVEVGVAGPVNEVAGASDDGMVIDFSLVSVAFRERIFDVCDHKFLNVALAPFGVEPTTAENIAAWIFTEMSIDLDGVGNEVEFVRVWETATSYAEVRR